eukprot:8576689-Pyramimonas_sp.AAC.1
MRALRFHRRGRPTEDTDSCLHRLALTIRTQEPYWPWRNVDCRGWGWCQNLGRQALGGQIPQIRPLGSRTSSPTSCAPNGANS